MRTTKRGEVANCACSDSDRKVEVIIIRDPDGPVDAHVFIDGRATSVTEFMIDAGAGWCWADWRHCRDQNITAASPSARQVLLAVYADPPGGKYVEERGDAQWLDGGSPDWTDT
ncbi:hypothetical protein [Nocardia sp. R7R-8]|uniref:hypothetical protein n=1 Tax=Nocardia sp. R7R-8 TaxID=3459304 RepID=UPI00403D887D